VRTTDLNFIHTAEYVSTAVLLSGSVYRVTLDVVLVVSMIRLRMMEFAYRSYMVDVLTPRNRLARD
jgi:hypothetical protein